MSVLHENRLHNSEMNFNYMNPAYVVMALGTKCYGISVGVLVRHINIAISIFENCGHNFHCIIVRFRRVHSNSVSFRKWIEIAR